MEQKDTWYFQIFNWNGKGRCPSIRKRGRIEKLGRLRSEKGQEGPNSTFENCLQFVSSSPSLQSTRPSHLLGTISHCQKDQTLCVAFEKNWRRKRFLACINKFKRKGIANRIVANSCYGLKLVKIIVQYEQSHKACALRALGLLLADGTPTVGGERLFELSANFFYGNSCNSGTESRKMVSKVGN